MASSARSETTLALVNIIPGLLVGRPRLELQIRRLRVRPRTILGAPTRTYPASNQGESDERGSRLCPVVRGSSARFGTTSAPSRAPLTANPLRINRESSDVVKGSRIAGANNTFRRLRHLDEGLHACAC